MRDYHSPFLWKPLCGLLGSGVMRWDSSRFFLSFTCFQDVATPKRAFDWYELKVDHILSHAQFVYCYIGR